MFDEAELRRVLGLHEKAYRLLLWLNEGMLDGRPPLGKVAEALAFSDAALAWVRRHAAQLPEELRPADADLEPFCRLFASYLSTSFEVAEGRRISCRGCWCCGYWNGNRHLRTRNPDKKAKGVARELKLLYLRSLAPEAELGDVLARKDLAPAISLAAYAAELVRRSKFASQGEGVLALWREVAWTPAGSPNRKFRLDAAKILQAERALREALA